MHVNVARQWESTFAEIIVPVLNAHNSNFPTTNIIFLNIKRVDLAWLFVLFAYS